MPKAELIALDFASLADLDNGTIANLLGWHLQAVARDLKSRPWEKKARTVTLQLAFTPRMNSMGELTKAALEIDAKHKLPIHKTETYEVAPSEKGFVLNQDFPSELDSQPLFPMDPEQESDPDQRDLDTMLERTMDEIAQLLHEHVPGVRAIYGLLDCGSDE